eukprot:jgi/Undpi1/13589/HiC_scaffold_83.g14095.m1
MCINDRDSRFLWANENFVRLIGKTKQEIIGLVDTNKDHKDHDRTVMDLGKPLLNFHENIDVVLVPGTPVVPVITTKKRLLRKDSEIVGVAVCFALDNAEDAEKLALDSVKHNVQDVDASAVGAGLS